MSDKKPAVAPGSTMHLWSSHRPQLDAGTYTITVEQTIVHTADPGRPATESFSDSFNASLTFNVGGNRFSLAPSDVHAVFPPAGSEGDYGKALPHVVVTRSTLPWERSACREGDEDKLPPWLALLVLDDTEFTGPQTITMDKLPASLKQGLTNEEQNGSVNVIDVLPAALLNLVPNPRELSLLTHVRPAGNDFRAVIVSKRAPRRGVINHAHLVSLERRYQKATDASVIDRSLVRLVCLRSWSFACKSRKDSLIDRLDAIKSTAARLHLPLQRDHKTFHLTEARVVDRTADPKGNADQPPPQPPLTWYRGPLAAHEAAASAKSCSAAYELGRLLALQTAAVTTELLHARITYVRSQISRKHPLIHASPLQDANPQPSPPPALSAATLQWLKRCTLLDGIPFHYLIPDEHMLPLESMRLFQLDDAWIKQLLNGALSIGDLSATADLLKTVQAMTPVRTAPRASGLLLRSDVVTGWPGLLPQALDTAGKPLDLLSAQRLSPNVLLCLFDGLLASVRILNPPTMLHFELEHSPTDDSNTRLLSLKNEPAATTSASLTARLLERKYQRLPRNDAD